jgi:hypothetical protein
LEAGEPGSKTPIDVGDQAMVELADWNNDGRLDLLVGAQDGRVSLYLNDASSGPPDLRGPLMVQYGDQDLVVPSGYAAPALVDLDGDGRRDLVVGNAEGLLLLYANRGTDTQPEYNSPQLLAAGGTKIDLDGTPRARVSVGDWNGDGLADLVFGAADGLVRLILAESAPTATETEDRVLGTQGAIHVHTFYAAGPAAFPPTVTISQAAGQADPTNQTTVHFAVVFSEPVLDFDASDVTLGGTAGATYVEVTTADQMAYDVAVSGMALDGTVTITVPAGAAHDADGAASLEPTIVDDTVTYDGTPPSVTIELAAGQSNPTNRAPVNFAVVFSEPVSDFTSSDVTLAGTAGATTAVVTGEGTTYNVEVSGMTHRGTVVVQIAARAAFDAAGNGNTAASGSVDGVLYNGWHNFDLPCDVDANGKVEPLDVLQTINYINSHPSQPSLPPPPEGEHLYYDVDDDGACAAIDVLTVINWINSHPAGASEGEAVPSDFATFFFSFPAAPRDASGGLRLGATSSPWRPIGVPHENGRPAAAWSPRKTADPFVLTPRKRHAEPWTALDADLLALDSVLTDIASDLATGWPGTSPIS